MPAYETYHEKLDKHNIVRTREILSALPPYCQEFFRGIADRTSTRTRLAKTYEQYTQRYLQSYPRRKMAEN